LWEFSEILNYAEKGGLLQGDRFRWASTGRKRKGTDYGSSKKREGRSHVRKTEKSTSAEGSQDAGGAEKSKSRGFSKKEAGLYHRSNRKSEGMVDIRTFSAACLSPLGRRKKVPYNRRKGESEKKKK